MDFQRSLSDSKSVQVFRTLLSILTDLNNVIVWVVSALPPISNPSEVFTYMITIIIIIIEFDTSTELMHKVTSLRSHP